MAGKNNYQDPHAQREAKQYDNPVPSRELILQVLEDQGRPLLAHELHKLLSVEDEASQEAFGFRLKAMLRDAQLLQNRAGRLCLIDRVNLIPGRVELHKGGFGFIIPDAGGEDLFLPPSQLRKAMNGDRILAQEIVHSTTKRREAAIIEITQRALTHVVGQFYRKDGSGWLQSSSQLIQSEIIVADLGGLKPSEGDYLRAEIIDYPSKRHPMRVTLTECIASPDDRGMEIEVALRNFDLPFIWPDDVIAQAKAIPDEVTATDAKGRYDLRDLPMVTIDGEDARDFDDAIYAKKRLRGGWRLIVAIADVSHYVRPDSALDREAHKRGTSIYFPSRVIPMLPEKLSNGLCSLNPDVDRLCLCCDMLVSANGRISRFVFREGIMRSHKRLTYTQVGDFIEHPSSEAAQQLANTIDKPVAHVLHDFHQLFLALRKQREVRGAVDFDSSETRALFDDQLKIKAIVPVERNVAHTMIEEAMLAANVCTARLLEKSKLPALYRNHDGPKIEKLAGLVEFLGPLGLKLDWDGESEPEPAIFQTLASQLDGRPDRGLISLMMLRTLSQAKYETECKGHFGLAYDYYTHFTSPIRRYPDLLAHRALRFLIRQNEGKQVDNSGKLATIAREAILPFSPAQMVELGEHCSLTERRADDASRDVMKWLKCQFMEQHLGDSFAGTISGVTGFGLFIELDDLHIDGLAHIATLDSDYYQFDARMQHLQGQASGYRYRLGDRVEVTVAAVNVDERKIDLQLESHQPHGKTKKSSKSKKPKKPRYAQKKGAKAGPKSSSKAKANTKPKPKTRQGPPRGRKAARRKTKKTN